MYAQYFNTIADMVNANSSSSIIDEFTPIIVDGYYNIGDGGGGIFSYKTTYASPENLGTVFDAANFSGKFVRNLDDVNYINVKWFGAYGDGINIDTDAFQRALATGCSKLYIPAVDRGYVVAPIDIGDIGGVMTPVTIFGDNRVRSRIYPVNDASKAIFTLQSHFIEIRSLSFENPNNFESIKGIEFKKGPCTIDNCYFHNLDTALYNHHLSIADEQDIRGCRFFQCNIAIDSTGYFRNSHIHQFCVFHSCKIAIRLIQQSYTGGDPYACEGVTIQDCLFYYNGSVEDDTPCLQLEVAYVYVINCMVDLCYNNALRMKHASFSKLTNSWFASKHSEGKSTILLQGNCSDLFIDNCNINDSRNFNLDIQAQTAPPSHITVTNTSFYTDIDELSSGDIFVNGAWDVRLIGCNLHHPSENCVSITNDAVPQPPPTPPIIPPTSLLITCSWINGGIVKGNPQIPVKLVDCINKQTVKIGYAVIPSGISSYSFSHGLTVLTGQTVNVLATNSSSFEYITAGISGGDIVINRSDSSSGTITVNYRAEVFDF